MKAYIQNVQFSAKMHHSFCCGRDIFIRDPDLFLNLYATI